MSELPISRRRDPDEPAAYALSGATRKALAAVVEDLRIEQEIVARRYDVEASQEFVDQGVFAALDAYRAAVEQIDGALRADAGLRGRPRG